MNFDSMDDVNATLVRGRFNTLPEEFTVSGVHYTQHTTNTVQFVDLFYKNDMGMIMYHLDRKPENMERFKEIGAPNADDPGLHEWIIFAWKARGMNVVPIGAKTTTPARVIQTRVKGLGESDAGETELMIEAPATSTPAQDSAAQKKEKEWQARVVGKTAQISFPQFGRAGSVQGKVDTGANISSLHAEDINVDGDTVTCKIPALAGENNVRMRVQTQQAVKSADGGTEYRPVVHFNITINGQAINDVEFNLNDRSKMNNDVLIGHNILEKAKLIVDPTMENENVDWPELEKLFEGIEPSDTPVENYTVEEAYRIITDNNISFDELFEQARTAGVEAADDIEA